MRISDWSSDVCSSDLTVFSGLAEGLREARETLGISSYLLMSFLRHLSEEEAMQTLEAALPLREAYRDLWVGIGLDSAELGNPPEKFARVYARCKALGRSEEHTSELQSLMRISSA